jgi:hypothetical protein
MEKMISDQNTKEGEGAKTFGQARSGTTQPKRLCAGIILA